MTENDTKLIEETEKLKIDQSKPTIPIKIVKYCLVCTFPEEYCDYSHDILKKRKEFPITNETPLQNPQPTTEDPNITPKPEEEKKKETPVEEEKKETKDFKKKKVPDKIHIKNTKRGKKKASTVIRNVELFGLDLKEVSKLLSKKFACSSSVSKDEENKDSIVMTGEFEDDLKEFLMLKFTNLKDENFFIERIKKKIETNEDQD